MRSARWWGGPSASQVERLVRTLGDEVTPVDVEGTPSWALASHARAIAGREPARSVRLLPTFDQYVIGSTAHSRALMPGEFRERVHRQAGWGSPVLSVDGRIEGIWKHTRSGKRVTVAIEPFVPQPEWVRKGSEGARGRSGGGARRDAQRRARRGEGRGGAGAPGGRRRDDGRPGRGGRTGEPAGHRTTARLAPCGSRAGSPVGARCSRRAPTVMSSRGRARRAGPLDGRGAPRVRRLVLGGTDQRDRRRASIRSHFPIRERPGI